MSTRNALSNTAIILAIIGLAIGGGGGYLISNNSLQPIIDELETDVEALDTHVENLMQYTASLEQEIVDYEDEIESLEEDVSDYQSEVSSLTSEKSTLQNQVATLQSEVSSKISENSGLLNQISVLESNLDEAEKVCIELENQISTLETSLESLQTQQAVTPGYSRFALYGVEFEFPQGYWLYVDDYGGGWASSDLAHVMVANTDDSDMYDVAWVFTSTAPDLEGGLDGGFEAVQGVNLVLGNRESYTIKGHTMRYQNYTVELEGEMRHGILGCFYCDESNYYFVVQHMSVSSDVHNDFFQFIDSIKCHKPPMY